MEPETSRVTRRSLLGAGAGVPLTVALLSACGESSGTGQSAGGYGAPASPEPSEPAASDASEEPASEEPDAEEPAGASLAAVADIPVGGALVVQDSPDGKPVVLARPGGDRVVAFSAVCTHRGCTVRAEQATIRCPCHGSTFDLAGTNTGGPAPSPLPRVDVTVEDGQVRPA